ncbi:MAG TPA: putative molybdenum carrier protein [Xanthobacteraceae bacterium]|nr:putative molybdenum carrier protein [Xanthobacteraceae bacterium]
MALKIITGGQSGVDRAALDVAIALGIPYGGWCPRGGWAEDLPDPPGLLARYPRLRETPLSDPAQRTQWNLRDSEAVLIIALASGLAVSKGTALAREIAERDDKPLLVVGPDEADAALRAAQWLAGLLAGRDRNRLLALGIGGPRESEAPGIYQTAVEFLRAVLRAAAI